jgi:hypothetical protein
VRADTEAESRTPALLARFAEQARAELGAAGIPLLAAKAEKQRDVWVADQLVEAGRARVERALAAPVHRFELDAEALAQRDPRLAIRLAGFGSAAKREELLVLIRAPRDDWGRWIYQQMNEAPPGIRLRARSEIGRPPAIELRQP